MGGQRIRLACLSSPNVDSSEIVTPLPNIQLAPLPLTLEMPVPWEALIPFGLLTSMFGVTGTLMSMVKRAANDGKPPRYHLDSWEEMMMERDRRLTGSMRGQKLDAKAPDSFATNSVWYTEATS